MCCLTQFCEYFLAAICSRFVLKIIQNSLGSPKCSPDNNSTLKVFEATKQDHRLQVSLESPGTVPDLAALSLVPEDPSTSLLFVPDLRKTVVLTCYSDG